MSKKQICRKFREFIRKFRSEAFSKIKVKDTIAMLNQPKTKIGYEEKFN